MPPDLDRRTYDVLRLVDRYEPIGSIQLADQMKRYGYDIKDRTIRLHLSELDEHGLTEKVPGKGRRLTERGREELGQGEIGGRLEHIRSRIASLANRVTYDPERDAGDVVVSAMYLPESALEAARSLTEGLDDQPMGPIPIDVSESGVNEPGAYRILAPSSITIDGILLSNGIDARLAAACLLEYEPTAATPTAEGPEPDPVSDQAGGYIVRYRDVISGEGATIDVLSLLIEAGRTSVLGTLDGETGVVAGDTREFPVNQFRETQSLIAGTRESIGGVYALARPQERTPMPSGESGWTFSSLTYVSSGEALPAAFAEADLATSWDTLYGIVPRRELAPIE